MAKLKRGLGLACLAGILVLALTGCVAAVGLVSGPAIQIGSITLPRGGTGEVPVQAFNIPGGLQGIEVSAQAGDFLTFDPNVIKVLDVKAVEPFLLDSVNIDNAAGRISFVARTPPGGPFPSDGVVIQLQVQHVGGQGTSLQLEVTNLANGFDNPIEGIEVIEGEVNIR
jgi:hypothetical protein